jgi:hypothetical protein
MSTDTITLTPKKYGKLGVIHCGVSHEGFIAVGGDVSDIADGKEVTFERSGIKVKRNGKDHIFSKIT